MSNRQGGTLAPPTNTGEGGVLGDGDGDSDYDNDYTLIQTSRVLLGSATPMIWVR